VSTDYKLIYHKSAVKFIVKQEKAIQERISIGLRGLLESPPEGDISSMKGHAGLYRLRVGALRVLFHIDHIEKVIYIEAVGSRGDIYK
jgi:mRNA interferase RelE/StbE